MVFQRHLRICILLINEFAQIRGVPKLPLVPDGAIQKQQDGGNPALDRLFSRPQNTENTRATARRNLQL